MTAALMFFMRQLARLPLPVLRALGAGVGRLLYALARKRRRIAHVNLRLCYPDWSEARVQAVARRSFVLFSQAFFDRAWLWHAPPAVVRQRLRITGATEDLTRPGAVVMFAPHFYGMDAGGSAVMDQIERPACTIYSTQSNPAIDAWMRAGRLRFGQATLLSRQEGLKPIVRALREGKMLYLLPDMDLGPQESIFVPFFGIATATIPNVSDYARQTGFPVFPLTFLRDADGRGLSIKVYPPFDDFPSGDDFADTLRMNRFYEEIIRDHPQQYLWVHRRFKTRPPGEESLYADL